MEILELIRKYTEVGNAVGLEGNFCIDFGFEQIKQKIADDESTLEEMVLAENDIK